jgi:hypothetical protein
VEPGYRVTDSLDESDALEQRVTVTGNFSVFAPAFSTFVRSYAVSDTAGNRATTVTRTLIIGDGTPPRIVVLGPTPCILLTLPMRSSPKLSCLPFTLSHTTC